MQVSDLKLRSFVPTQNNLDDLQSFAIPINYGQIPVDYEICYIF